MGKKNEVEQNTFKPATTCIIDNNRSKKKA